MSSDFLSSEPEHAIDFVFAMISESANKYSEEGLRKILSNFLTQKSAFILRSQGIDDEKFQVGIFVKTPKTAEIMYFRNRSSQTTKFLYIRRGSGDEPSDKYKKQVRASTNT